MHRLRRNKFVLSMILENDFEGMKRVFIRDAMIYIFDTGVV